jgi:hypothetical protein
MRERKTAREASLLLVSNRARHRFTQQIEIFCWKLVLIPGQRIEYYGICAVEPTNRCAPLHAQNLKPHNPLTMLAWA